MIYTILIFTLHTLITELSMSPEFRLVPTMRVEDIHIPAQMSAHVRPLAQSRIAAGFPSPADDYMEGTLDLNLLLVKRPAATFFVRVSGDSMSGAGIESGDLLVVDRSRQPGEASVVIAVLYGELTVKSLCRRDGRLWLVAGNDAYPPIEVGEEADFTIWGVVTAVIHEF